MDEEDKIIHRLIEVILQRGYSITVTDEEEIVLRRSQDPDLIMSSTRNSDLTRYHLVDAGKQHGVFLLIHGNGEDVISDHSANEICDEICKEVLHG